jgi:XTP/dITP diphosphohydrolase
MLELIFATSNLHKAEEVSAILDGFQVRTLRDFPEVELPEETGSTFLANAELKALAASRCLPDQLILADDSGLEVDALGGKPGVHSARYAGEKASDAENRHLLQMHLRVLAEQPKQRFPARFRCCLVVAKGGQVLHTAEGAVEGHIQLTESGTGGFGYDPLFIPEGHQQTFGSLPAAVKNQLSHRARALATLKEKLS